jgi:hypothetical protein
MKPLNPASGIPINVFSSSTVPVKNLFQPFYKLPGSESSPSGASSSSSATLDSSRQPFKGFNTFNSPAKPRPLLSDAQLISMAFTVLSLTPFAGR